MSTAYTDSEIIRKRLGERAKDILAVHPDHFITSDIGFQKFFKLLGEFKDVRVPIRFDQSEIKLSPEKIALQIIGRDTDAVKGFSTGNQVVSLSNLKGAWKREEMLDNLQALQNPRICNGRLSAETNGISFDITSCSRSSTATDSKIMRERLGESTKDILAADPDHSIKTDKNFSFDDWVSREESGENNIVTLDINLGMAACSIRSISTGGEELIVIPTTSYPSTQQNQPFENEKKKKRHSHEISRKGCMHSCLQYIIRYV